MNKIYDLSAPFIKNILSCPVIIFKFLLICFDFKQIFINFINHLSIRIYTKILTIIRINVSFGLGI